MTIMICQARMSCRRSFVSFMKQKPITRRVSSCGVQVHRCASFLYVDDMADACVFLLEHYDGEQHVNIGTGKEVTIRELAEIVRRVVGYEGGIVWNQEMPDGTPRKLTDVTKLHKLGWTHKIELEEGVQLPMTGFGENVGGCQTVREMTEEEIKLGCD